eukprot:m.38447 g.38447  ORF g.38447 m.38447 type:complete len:103 (-) comp16492_c0_seq2:26-334(-)
MKEKAVCHPQKKKKTVHFVLISLGAAKESISLVDEADGLLVIGTSLAVMSAFRLVRNALRRPIDVFVINRGWTRADDLLPVGHKIDMGCDEVVPSMFEFSTF